VRILAITAGAGGMYCGSCVRDNALAAELKARGHDVTLLPVYTPTRTDEPNVSEERVFFGGISVYLEQRLPLFRRTPEILDRLWDAPGVIRALTGRGVSTDPSQLGGMTVSMLEGEHGFQRKEHRKLLRWLARQQPFDLVSLPNSLLLGMAPTLARELGRPIVCTLQGEDLFLEGLPDRYRQRAKELIGARQDAVDVFIAFSDYYAGFMASYVGIPRRKIEVVPLGISLDGHAPRQDIGGPFTIGYFARVAPEKGLALLADAYRLLRRERGLPPSRLEVAGYLAPDHRSYLAGVEAKMKEWGLADEFQYRGVLDRAAKIRFLQGLDLLSVPSPYAEPKGLYLLEAMANGVPVVQPRHGAFPEVIGRTGGGLLFEPGDASSLADTILALHRDPKQRAELGRKGAEGVRRDFDAGRMAERTIEVFAAAVGQLVPERVER
jgi:glycosyltransferase involved in cell wall biosynthesis